MPHHHLTGSFPEKQYHWTVGNDIHLRMSKLSDTPTRSESERLPKTPLDDPIRLTALHATALMDSPPEEAFDRAVRVATRLLGTPVGLVSLVDGERQFFKAQTGLPEHTAAARQTPLSHSFCQHVVETELPLSVRDAREDPLVRKNLAIKDLGVIAYLGVPLHAPDGHVLGSFCAIQSEPRDWTADEQAILEDVAAGIEAEISLRSALVRSSELEQRATEAEERFRLALRAGQIGTYDFDPATQVAQWDAKLYEIWGLATDETDIFGTVRQTIHPDDLQAWETDVANSLDPDGPGQHDLEMRIHRPDTGDLRWVHAVGKATFVDGTPTRLIGTVRDITDQKTSEEREKMLMQELNHRVKNLFAVVSGMISMTARASDTPDNMATALRGRVDALAAAHALIQPAISADSGLSVETTLHDLLETLVRPHVRSEVALQLKGLPVSLKPDGATSLALVLHELATNAAKYGALSQQDGRLTVAWELIDFGQNDIDPKMTLTWSERGGPSVDAPPTHKGFGSRLIDLTVKGQLRGGLQSDWHRNGVEHTLSMSAGLFT